MRPLLEGKRVSRISVRGFAVASATAVTTVGAVVGVAAGGTQGSVTNTEATAADATIADIPAGQQAQVQTASLTQQADVQFTQADAAALKSAQESARKAAAQTAQDKKDAADEKAAKAEKDAKDAKERKEKELAASSSDSQSASDFTVKGSYSVAEVQAMARQIVPADQFQCFSNIVNHESTWNYKAVNASSGAYGLVQALPGHKMSSAGADWQTNPATQIKWGLNYMNSSYKSPCGAWSFWQANHWY
ncbi:transglycosylase SLT domain-containing protein [Streptomyces celluloflavus]|uniref:aggregation-promoting factor C-terminal-like domain-containing protein n=1 Tax=Streptomyces celluloflavus TaxID=58344 RepID=UPI0015598AC2|nr:MULTISPECIES: transglycosylase SLT domain-containing protein [Streptomyces]WSK14828.1 lytic transglycosylase domain-containing protein [Streptomyces celluloflavus]